MRIAPFQFVKIRECLELPIGSMYGIYTNIGGILMVNVTIYSIHGSYGLCESSHLWVEERVQTETRIYSSYLILSHPSQCEAPPVMLVGLDSPQQLVRYKYQYVP